MARNTLSVVLLAVFAGAAAGMAVQLFLTPGDSGAASTPRTSGDAPTEESGIAADVEDLRLEVAALRQREDELELALSDATSRIEGVNAELAKALEEDGALSRADEGNRPLSFGNSKIQVMGSPQAGATSSAPTFSFGRAGKGFELLRLPEEERWAKLREELSLDAYQESELKRIRDDMRAAMQDHFKVDPATGEMRGKLDIAKMISARQKAEERVKNLLTEDQHEKYEKEGYGAAIGIGSSSVAFSVSTSIQPRGK